MTYQREELSLDLIDAFAPLMTRDRGADLGTTLQRSAPRWFVVRKTPRELAADLDELAMSPMRGQNDAGGNQARDRSG